MQAAVKYLDVKSALYKVHHILDYVATSSQHEAQPTAAVSETSYIRSQVDCKEIRLGYGGDNVALKEHHQLRGGTCDDRSVHQ